MMNRTGMKGNMDVIKGKLKQAYGNLTDDDLKYEEGKEDEFFGRVGQRVGKGKDEVRRFVDDLLR